MSRNYTHFPIKNLQQGAALFISLVILLILAMIGASAIQTVTLQERMATNLKDQTLAFAAVESALRDAERRIAVGTLQTGMLPPTAAQPKSADASATLALCWNLNEPHPDFNEDKFDPNTPPWWKMRADYDWWSDSNSRSYNLTEKILTVSEAEEPLYLFEQVAFESSDKSAVWNCYQEDCSALGTYRITARSPGATVEAVRYMQSIFSWIYRPAKTNTP